MKRWARLAMVGLLALAFGGPAAMAQNEASPPNFWMKLFGGGASEQSAPATPAAKPLHRPRKHVRDFVPATTTRAPGTPGGAPVVPTVFIDVVGDSLAVQAADGLTQAYSDRPEVAIAGKGRESSGLVRDDYFDWPKAARDLAGGKDHIDFAVVMIGSNDLQGLKDGADMLDPLTDRWRALYVQRIAAIVEPFRSAHIPVAWIGLPPMRTERYNADVIKLNAIFKEQAQKAGAVYVDIWDAFADQNGQYDAFGPDIDGQNAKLRGVDGIHFTKAGARKVAHFLEADINRALGKAKPQGDLATLPPDIEQAALDINAQIRREMGAPPHPGAREAAQPERPLAGPILSLTAKPVSPGGALATRTASAVASPLAERVLGQGQTAPPRAGRADDFAWPRL